MKIRGVQLVIQGTPAPMFRRRERTSQRKNLNSGFNTTKMADIQYNMLFSMKTCVRIQQY